MTDKSATDPVRNVIGVAGTMLAAVIAMAPVANGNEYEVGSHYVGDIPAATTYVGDLPCSESGSCSGASSGNGCPGGSLCSGSGAGTNGRGLCGSRDEVTGKYIPRAYGRPDLFYNYFTQGYVNTTNAQMYLSPLPIPPNVGHTFFTYQPFYPHHMLYWHHDKYHRYYDNGRGLNRTHAIYYSPPVRQAIQNFYWNKLRLPR